MEKTRILVAEDEPLILRTLGDRLAQDGYEVLRAENGRVALSLLEEHPVDVVLTDIVMPEMEGIELILHLRKAHPEIRIVCMSAYDELYLQTARRLGAVRVLVKPFEWEDLIQAIHVAEASAPTVRFGAA